MKNRNPVVAAFAALSLLGAATPLPAQWTVLDLPNLSSSPPHFGANAFAHLPDGRFLYGNEQNLWVQDAFESSAVTAFTGVPSVDPSFIAVLDDDTAAIGAGGFFAATPIHSFNPSHPGAPAFASFQTVVNYTAVFRDSSGLYVGGLDSTGESHVISHVPLSGGPPKVIIDDVSAFSAGIARDGAGNLYVPDNDDLKLYKFTKAQLDAALIGPALTLEDDGEFLFQLAVDATLAVDGLGRIWAAGFQENGLQVFDPVTDAAIFIVPEGFENSNFKVGTFEREGESYVAWTNQEGFSTGDAVKYGYATASSFSVPEPSAACLLLLCLVTLGLRRKV